jgi:hypothetical protein
MRRDDDYGAGISAGDLANCATTLGRVNRKPSAAAKNSTASKIEIFIAMPARGLAIHCQRLSGNGRRLASSLRNRSISLGLGWTSATFAWSSRAPCRRAS